MTLPPYTQHRRRTRNYDVNDSNLSEVLGDVGNELAGKAPLVHTHLAADITDSTAVGRALLTAPDAAAQKATLGIVSTDIGDSTAAGRALLTAANNGAQRTALGLATVAATGAFADLVSHPTTLAGYGITDAAPKASPAFTGLPSFPAVAFASLPAASAAPYARVFVTDSTVAHAGNAGAVITGGGTNVVPAYSDGTNWRIG